MEGTDKLCQRTIYFSFLHCVMPGNGFASLLRRVYFNVYTTHAIQLFCMENYNLAQANRHDVIQCKVDSRNKETSFQPQSIVRTFKLHYDFSENWAHCHSTLDFVFSGKF